MSEKIHDLQFCSYYYFKVSSLITIGYCDFPTDMAGYFVETEMCSFFLLLQMFCLSPSWERSQILCFLPMCLLCSHRNQQVPGKRRQLLRLLFAIAIAQWELSRNWGGEVSAWSLTGGSCGIQGERKVSETKTKRWGRVLGAAGSMLAGDPSTACR